MVRIEGATIVEAFRDTVRRVPSRPALHQRSGSGWRTLSWAEYGQAVAEVTAGLAEMGIGPGEQVAILSGNCLEWHLADFGALCNGSVTVPIYQTSAPEQVSHVLEHSEARACFVENHELLAKVLLVREGLPKLQRVIVFDGDPHLDDPFLADFSGLRATGAARLQREPALFECRSDAVGPDDVATLVYTSGTTGPPKGAMVTHANIMVTIRSIASMFGVREGERFLSFLPLSHVAERMMSDFAPVAIGGETWFARSLATVAEDLRDCRPTIFFAVPRIWEKFQEAVLERLAGRSTLERLVVNRYIDLGKRVSSTPVGTKPPPWELLPHRVLDAVIGTALRRELGLDQAHILVSAAAPIHPDLLRWFHGLGLPALELYGQTETCGPTTCNPPGGNRIGTVGTAIPGVHVRIADDGEILARGDNVCAGYFRDTESTQQLIDPEGWMHTGDTGILDEDGYLRLTGRKKDLIITAAGQNIAPLEIETGLSYHELVSEAVVVGEGRRYLTALLTLDSDALAEWAYRHDKVADLEALATDPDVVREIDRVVEKENTRRSRVEWVKKYRILAHDFTVAGGELTPTLKVRRGVVYDKYRDLIDEMYEET